MEESLKDFKEMNLLADIGNGIMYLSNGRTFSSQNDFIIQAVNDFYDRHLAISDDPYLETREKEDAFADRIVEAVFQGRN